MKRTTTVIAGLALAATPAAALAQGQGQGQGNQGGGNNAATTISALDARPNPLVFGTSTELSGRLSGGDVRGKTVRLEVDEVAPFGDAYVPLNGVTTTTNTSGRFSFMLKPESNTQYRAIAQTSPPVTSAPRLVLVRPAVGLLVSDTTPRRGQLVRFRGTVRPDDEGSALIQRRSPSGRFVTVARTALRDTGPAYATYSRRIRIRRDGVYRVKVPGDEDHVNGFSRLRTLDVR